jgi:pimeloyl-ACP methyl ester carboxylesterase
MSFGATYAADLATRGHYDVRGYVGFVAPVSAELMRKISDYPSPYYTPEMKRADQDFEKSPSEASWKRMLGILAPIYFTPPFVEKGRKLMVDDESDYHSYLDVFFPYAQGKVGSDVPGRLKAFRRTKILAAGEADHLVPRELIELDARKLGCKFEVVPKAPHFILYEQPERTTELFEKYFGKETR